MKILITGISGFVGINLLESLKEHHWVWGLGNHPPKLDGIAGFCRWDQIESIPEVDAIIHLAGKAHDTKNTTDTDEYFRINVGLTKKIFDHFLESKAKKFVYFSSVKAVADVVETILTENDIPNPGTPYGKSKLEAEKYIQMQTLNQGKQVYILRPAMIHGPGNKGNLNLLFNLILKGIPYPLGAFENQRSFVSIDNLTHITRQLLDKDIPSGVFNVADDDTVSTNEIVSLIGEAIGTKPRIWNLPVGLVNILSKTGDFLKLPLNSDKLQKLTENYIVSNNKLKQTLGATLPVQARQGLLLTLKSFQKKK